MMQHAQEPAPSEEPYEVGVGVITKYIRGTQDAHGPGFVQGHRINATTGEYETYGSNYASAVYIPVKPSYTLEKTGRINALAYYADDYTFIACVTSYNQVGEATLEIPQTAAWIRVGTPGTGVSNCEITRMA